MEERILLVYIIIINLILMCNGVDRWKLFTDVEYVKHLLDIADAAALEEGYQADSSSTSNCEAFGNVIGCVDSDNSLDFSGVHHSRQITHVISSFPFSPSMIMIFPNITEYKDKVIKLPNPVSIGLNYINGWSYDSYCNKEIPHKIKGCAGLLHSSCGNYREINGVCISATRNNRLREVKRLPGTNIDDDIWFKLASASSRSDRNKFKGKPSNFEQVSYNLFKTYEAMKAYEFDCYLFVSGDIFYTEETGIFSRIATACIFSVDLHDLPIKISRQNGRLYIASAYLIDGCVLCTSTGSYEKFLADCAGPLILYNNVRTPKSEIYNLQKTYFPVNVNLVSDEYAVRIDRLLTDDINTYINNLRAANPCDKKDTLCRNVIIHNKYYSGVRFITVDVKGREYYFFDIPNLPTFSVIDIEAIEADSNTDYVILGVDIMSFAKFLGKTITWGLRAVFYVLIGILKFYIPVWQEILSLIFWLFSVLYDLLLSQLIYLFEKFCSLPYFIELSFDLIIFISGSEDITRIIIFTIAFNFFRALNYYYSYIFWFFFIIIRYNKTVFVIVSMILSFLKFFRFR